MNVRTQIMDLRKELRTLLIERDDEIDGVLMAMLARQHVLLVGPPGTAKSMVARLTAQAFEGARYYEKLMMKTTTPSEMFGPPSLAALKVDEFRRNIEGYLPTANVAFIDEVFKGSSAILNGLLAVLNERVFHNNGKPTPVPLEVAVGASNELPDPEEGLQALYDRFLLRYRVQRIREAGAFRSMLGTPAVAEVKTRLTFDDLHEAQKAVADLEIMDNVTDTLITIRAALEREGILPSDRRFKQALAVVRAHAFLEGASAVTPEHLTVLAHVMWDEPPQIAPVEKVIVGLCNPTQRRADEIYDVALSVMGEVDKEKDEKQRISAATEALGKLNKLRKQMDTITDQLRKENKTTQKAEGYGAKMKEMVQERILRQTLGCEPK